MKNENIDTKRKKFEEWRGRQSWYIVSKDDSDKTINDLMNTAAHSAWDAALASQQVAEPVTWQFRRFSGGSWSGWGLCEKDQHEAIAKQEMHWGLKHESRALYAVPLKPQCMPLTDEQLLHVYDFNSFNLNIDYEDFEQVARAVEAAHGIGAPGAQGEVN